MKKRLIISLLLGFSLAFIVLKVRVKSSEEIKTIQDKFVIGDRGAQPFYYVITKDSNGKIEQERTNVDDYAVYKIGHSYYFNSLTIYLK